MSIKYTELVKVADTIYNMENERLDFEQQLLLGTSSLADIKIEIDLYKLSVQTPYMVTEEYLALKNDTQRKNAFANLFLDDATLAGLENSLKETELSNAGLLLDIKKLTIKIDHQKRLFSIISFNNQVS